MEKYKRVVVTVEMEYQIPMIANERSSLGGLVKEVVQRWFEEIPIWEFHATRDSYKVGHSDKVIKAKIIKDSLSGKNE